MYLYVHSSVIYNSKDLETAQVPVSRWVDKKAVVHLHTIYHAAVKKKEILLFAAEWIDVESTMLSEISQSEKDKYHMISLIC